MNDLAAGDCKPSHAEGTSPLTQSAQFLRLVGSDSICAMLVLVLSMAVAAAYLNAHSSRSDYLLKYYGAAVMVAQGNGLVRPAPEANSPLEAFLANQRAAVAWDDIPDDIKTLPLSQFEALHRYAMLTLGGWWRVFGISWPAMNGLLTLFFGLSCACAYALLRLGMGRPLALALSVAFMFSPAMLYVLPQFRDFCKAPFVMAALLLIAFPIRHRLPWPLLLLTGTGLGLTLGIGMGFRQDFLMVLPVACFAVLFFWAGHWRRTWLPRVAALALLLTAFWIAAAPILRAAQQGANSAHNVVLGFAKSYEEALGYEAPYQIGHLYRDAFAHTQISAYGLYHSQRAAAASYWSGAYEPAGRELLYAIAHTFPYDLLLRGLRAEERILRDAPFVIDEFPQPFYPQPEFLADVRAYRMHWFGWLRYQGMALALLALLIMAAVSVRWAIAGFFIVTALCGYTSLQFHVRHFFPYEIFFFFALGLILHAIFAVTTAWWRPALRSRLLGDAPNCRPWQWPWIQRTATASAVAGAILLPILAGTWLWQSTHVARLYAAYADAPRTRLAADIDTANGAPLVKPRDFLTPDQATERMKSFRVQPGVLALHVQTSALPYAFKIIYRADAPLNDFSQEVTVPATRLPERWWLYVPVYQTTDAYFDAGQRRFTGIHSNNAPPGSLLGIYALSDLGELPLLITLVVPEDHTQATLEMRMVDRLRD